MVGIKVCQNHTVQPEYTLRKKSLRRNIRRFLFITAAAVHKISLPLALQQDALSLTHIQHGHAAGIRHRFQPRRAQRKAQADHCAAAKKYGLFLSAEQKDRQQNVAENQPDDDVDTCGIHGAQRKCRKNS